MKTRLGSILALFLCLTGCAGMASHLPAPIVNTCMAVKTFTPAQQSDILFEERKLSDGSILITVLQDWARMRAEARAGH